ncbi:hypothetical protein [Dokdonia sinensis]|nr:hypothetical protein [Dokdonia sinensis]
MKNILYVFLFLFCTAVFGQVDAISYQGVIINPETQEIPGQNVQGNVLNYSVVPVRFSIESAQGEIIYTETNTVATDRLGMFTVNVGRGTAEGPFFNSLEWDGTSKTLIVEVLLDGSYKVLDRKVLTFVPQAFHRNINATGHFEALGDVELGDDLIVRGTSTLNDSLSVNNEATTVLTGRLQVDQATILNDELRVNNGKVTRLTGDLDGAGAVQLNDVLSVKGTSQFDDTLTVDEATVLMLRLGVEGETTIAGDLEVATNKPTLLTGDLTVDGTSDFNRALNINSDLEQSGELFIAEDATLDGNLIVNRKTFLNDKLTVNNGTYTDLSGALKVTGQTRLNKLLTVSGVTDLESILRVNNESPTALSGTLNVDLSTNLNASLNVNNSSLTTLTGPLNVQGLITFDNGLTVNGRTNLNDALFVNNGELTDLSGTLRVDGVSNLDQMLNVAGEATFNNTLTVANASDTFLTGILDVDGETTLNSTLDVLNQEAAVLNGSLTVDGVTTLENTLSVTNGASTLFSGVLNVDQSTVFNNGWTTGNTAGTQLTGLLTVEQLATLNALEVANAGTTSFTGTLGVDGVTTLDNVLNIDGATSINNELIVTGAGNFGTIVAENLNIRGINDNQVATFFNTNDTTPNGLLIKLGKTHPRYLNGVYLGATQPGDTGSPEASVINEIKTKFINAGTISPGDITALIPDLISLAAVPNINNFVFEQINIQLSGVDFPSIDFPAIDFPGIPVPGFGTVDVPTPGVIFPGVTFFNGLNGICSGQACFSICFPFAGCTTICIPPVNVCVPSIPKIEFPRIDIGGGFTISPSFPDIVPDLPFLNTPGFLPAEFPILPDTIVFDALTNSNEYAVFTDKEGRVAGSIRAESIQDFLGRTINNDVYLLEVLSAFVGIDVADIKSESASAIVTLVSEYNKSGLEFASGNGDYAEWLERVDVNEYITAGDIVGVVGGKISKNLDNAEQIMVVSHRPIVQGNTPEQGKEYLGNTVAFIGQIPVKVIGKVGYGDYIVPHTEISGYGVAVPVEKMTLSQFEIAVGRAWNANNNEGPKLVNTVVGLQNGDWKNQFETLDNKQNSLNKGLETLEAKLKRIEQTFQGTVE